MFYRVDCAGDIGVLTMGVYTERARITDKQFVLNAKYNLLPRSQRTVATIVIF